jgi:hypothetical protein
MPLKLIAARRARGDFLGWRDELARTSRRGADYTFSVFARALSWATLAGPQRQREGERDRWAPATMTILPFASTSIRAIDTPAAVAPLTARHTSVCRNASQNDRR